MTVRAKKPASSIREELARIRGEISAFKYNTGKQVWQTGVRIDGADYSTSTTTPIAAQGSTFSSIKPTRRNTKLRCWIESHARAYYGAGATFDSGGLVGPKYKESDSGAWILPDSALRRSFLIATTASNAIDIDDTPTHFFELTQDQVNKDSGDWQVALFFSAAYAGNIVDIFAAVLTFEEIEA